MCCAYCLLSPKADHSVSRRVVRGIGQHYRGLDLSIWDGPIGLEEHGLARRRDQFEGVAPIEPDRPLRGVPGADQHRSRARAPQMPNQRAANATPLAARQDVSVTNEIDVAHRLEPNHAYERAILLTAP